MEEMVSCPLCCEKTFPNKASLIEHLSKYEETVKCSICNTLFTSLSLLLKHLREDVCSALNSQAINNPSNGSQSVPTDASNSMYENNTNVIEDNITSPTHLMSEFDEDTNQIYVELLKRPLLQDLEDNKLHNENGEQVNGCEGSSLNGVHTNIVTKQNSDGTISLTTEQIVKQEAPQETYEPEVDIRESENTEDPNEFPAEVYSCNTCCVTFTSVIDHIKTYHRNQDIIVESTNQNISVEPEKLDTENIETTKTTEVITKKILNQALLEATTKKFITIDEGYIIENRKEITKDKAEEVVVDKKGRKFSRIYVPTGKNIKEAKKESLLKQNLPLATAKKSPPKKTYHQVIMKNMMTLDGSSVVQVYFCISCNTYVSEMKEFREHPCKDSEENGNTNKATILEDVDEFLSTQVDVKTSSPMPVVALKDPVVALKQPLMLTDLEKGAKKPKYKMVFDPEFKCDICSTVFPTNKSLKLHRRMHDPHKIKPIEPPVEVQIDGSTIVDTTYLCTVCNKMIPTSYKHIHTMSHVAQDSFHCDICNKKFTSSDYLAMHMKAHNTGKVNTKAIDKSLPYSCVYCTRRFARPHEKVKHERIHTGEKPHSCEICGKTFRVAYCLTLHLRTHTGIRPYTCQHCGKRFKAHSVYNHHLLTHSDVRAYKCPYCPKAFKNSVQLAGHKNSHTKPFSCKDCNRPFASLYAVRCHTETHKRHNNLKFNCALCGASYARSFALNDHMKQAHNGVNLAHNEEELGHNEVELGHNEVELGHNEVELGHNEVELGHNEVELGHNEEELGHNEVELGHNEVELGHNEEELGHNEVELGHNEVELGHNEQDPASLKMEVAANTEYDIAWDEVNEIQLKTDMSSPTSASNFYEIADTEVEEILS